MDEQKHSWLPHLQEAVPVEAYGYKLDMYTIGLEGWRRGLTLKFHNLNIEKKLVTRYTLSYKGREQKFAISRGDNVTKEAIATCMNKDLTKEVLLEANVSVPLGRKFGKGASDQEIIEYFQTLGTSVVLKPTNAGGSKGVITDIKDVETLKKALIQVRQKLNYKEVLIEQFVSGTEYRIFVIGDQVAGVIYRKSPNVIGDGKRTIKQLIELKNKERLKNPYLHSFPIKMDKDLKNYIDQFGYRLTTVPKEGEEVILRARSNPSSGGDTVDATDDLSLENKNTAIDAIKAIAGLYHGAVDMIVDKHTSVGVVIEVNSKPQISSHLYPVIGKARDIPAAIVDYYFPETKGHYVNGQKEMFYYDFKSILETLRNGYAKEVIMPPIPKNTLIAKSFKLSGQVQGIGFRKWVHKHAFNSRLNGFVKNLANGNVHIVVAGRKGEVEAFTTLLDQSPPQKAKIKEIKKEEWKKPVKFGFEVLVDENIHLNEIDKLQKERDKAIRERNSFKREYNKLKQSRIWRYTLPIRKLGDTLKGSQKK